MLFLNSQWEISHWSIPKFWKVLIKLWCSRNGFQLAQSNLSYFGEDQEMVSLPKCSMLNVTNINQQWLLFKPPLVKYLEVSLIKIGLLLAITNKPTTPSCSQLLIKKNISLRKITIKEQCMLLMLIQIIYQLLEVDMISIWLKTVIKIAVAMLISITHMIAREEEEMIWLGHTISKLKS